MILDLLPVSFYDKFEVGGLGAKGIKEGNEGGKLYNSGDEVAF